MKNRLIFLNQKIIIMILLNYLSISAVYANTDFDRATDYFNQKRYGEAVNEYINAIKSNPQNPDYYNNLANTYSKLKNYDKAIEYYKKAIELSPTNKDFYYNLANTYVDAKKYYEAIYEYKKTIEIDPKDYEAFNQMGNAFSYQKKYAEALEQYNNALKVNPNYDLAYYNLGQTYFDTKDYEKSIENYKKALEINPNYEGAYYNMGLVYHDMGKYNDSIDSYKKAIELINYYADSHFHLAQEYQYIKDYEKAIKSYSEVLQINPNYELTYYNMALVYDFMGDYDRSNHYKNFAIESLKEVTESTTDYNRISKKIAIWSKLFVLTKPKIIDAKSYIKDDKLQAEFSYKGQKINGLAEEFGILETKLFIYDGCFKEGLANGKGKLIWKDKILEIKFEFEGEFENGQPKNGKIISEQNGIKTNFECSFENGQPKNGKIISEQNGIKTNFECSFENGQPKNGKMISEQNGIKTNFEGEFENGEIQNGKAIIYSADGSKREFNGSFKNGKIQNGKASTILPNNAEYTYDVVEGDIKTTPIQNYLSSIVMLDYGIKPFGNFKWTTNDLYYIVKEIEKLGGKNIKISNALCYSPEIYMNFLKGSAYQNEKVIQDILLGQHQNSCSFSIKNNFKNTSDIINSIYDIDVKSQKKLDSISIPFEDSNPNKLTYQLLDKVLQKDNSFVLSEKDDNLVDKKYLNLSKSIVIEGSDIVISNVPFNIRVKMVFNFALLAPNNINKIYKETFKNTTDDLIKSQLFKDKHGFIYPYFIESIELESMKKVTEEEEKEIFEIIDKKYKEFYVEYPKSFTTYGGTWGYSGSNATSRYDDKSGKRVETESPNSGENKGIIIRYQSNVINSFNSLYTEAIKKLIEEKEKKKYKGKKDQKNSL